MERLTYRIKQIIEPTYKANKGIEDFECVNKLGEYEDAEEQGLLSRLPCKVGDTVWQVTSEVHKHIVTCIAVRGDGVIICTENYETGIGFTFNAKRIGQRYFLTKEEAEQKLASMQKGE